MKKQFSRAISLLLIIVFTMTALPLSLLPSAAEWEGIYAYTVTDREAKITDCDSNTSGAITIPLTLGGYPVTSIGNNAFSYCASLTGITIPDSVTSIGAGAFTNCTSLTSVTIGNGVISIGDWAFKYCTSLTSVTIPDSVTDIGVSAFSWCTLLTSVTIGNGVTSIGDDVFSNCKSLTNATIGNGVLSIGEDLFAGCSSLKNITLTFLYIGGSENPTSSSYCKPFGYIFGKTDYTGSGVATTQYYPSDRIGSYITYTYYIPSSLKKVTVTGGNIPYGAFANCTGLDITLCNGVTGIGDRAFQGYTSLTDITIPDSVTSIGERAFYGCTSLTSVTIPDSVTGIGDYAFYGCTSLTSVTIPDSVTRIGGSAFYGCTSLTSVTIPDSVTGIDDYAFSNCKSLTSATIGNGVKYINNVFIDCTALTSITIGDSVTRIDDDAFSNCTSLSSINVNINNQSYSSENGVLFNKSKTKLAVYPKGKANSEYIVPDSVMSIGDYAFSHCTSLTSITIPDGVTSIGYNTFSHCTSLTSITIPDSVTSIGWWVFLNCTSLTNVSIGNAVKNIGDGAFEKCTSLVSVTVPDSVTEIVYNAFKDCSSLTSVTIPSSVTSIGGNAFSGCSSLNIYGYRDSEAQKYALANSIPFKELCSEHEFGTWTTRTPSTCKAEGIEIRICSVCSYEETRLTAKIPHTPGGYIIKKFATENEEGEKVRICSVCGKELEAPITIPKLSVWVNTFPDVSDGSWYLEALRFANTMGMIKGMDDGTFSPNEKMTRAMLVTLLGRLSGVSDGDYPGEKPFTDVETNAWYAPYVAWAKENGVVGGYPDGTFAPGKTITRQEMAKMFANYAKVCDGKDITSGLDEEKYASFTDVSSVAEWAKPEMLWATSIGLINGAPVEDGYALNPASTATRAEVSQLVYNYCTKIK